MVDKPRQPPIADPPRLVRKALVALAWLIALAAVVFLIARSDRDGPTPRPAASSSSQRAAPAAAGKIAALSPAVGRASQLAPSGARGVDEVEVCGIGWFKMKADGSPDENVLWATKTRLESGPTAARKQALDAVRADRSAQARTTALLLEAFTAWAVPTFSVS